MLADGPDPDADPVGYAQAQVLPLRQLKISDTTLQKAVQKLATAYQAYAASDRRSQTPPPPGGLQGRGCRQRDMPGSSKLNPVRRPQRGRPSSRRCSRAAPSPLARPEPCPPACSPRAAPRRARRSSGSITLYSGQHEQTTQSLVTAFEQKTGIKVNVRYDDEDTFADEIVAEKAHPGADVFYTENSPALEYLQDRACWPRSIPRRWPRPRASTTRRRATGSGSRPGSAC